MCWPFKEDHYPNWESLNFLSSCLFTEHCVKKKKHAISVIEPFSQRLPNITVEMIYGLALRISVSRRLLNLPQSH